MFKRNAKGIVFGILSVLLLLAMAGTMFLNWAAVPDRTEKKAVKKSIAEVQEELDDFLDNEYAVNAVQNYLDASGSGIRLKKTFRKCEGILKEAKKLEISPFGLEKLCGSCREILTEVSGLDPEEMMEEEILDEAYREEILKAAGCIPSVSAACLVFRILFWLTLAADALYVCLHVSGRKLPGILPFLLNLVFAGGFTAAVIYANNGIGKDVFAITVWPVANAAAGLLSVVFWFISNRGIRRIVPEALPEQAAQEVLPEEKAGTALQSGTVRTEQERLAGAQEQGVCPYCGEVLQSGDVYCPACGAKVGREG